MSKKKGDAAPARRITTCLFNYVPEQEGELSLVRGKLVTLLSTEGNWWRGECQGESGLFPRSFVRNPDEGSQLVVPRKQLGPGGDDEADRLREQLAEAQRQLKQAGSSERTAELEQALAEAKKQAAAESQIAAELRKGKAALEGILAATGKATAPAGGASDSTLIEDLKAQLDKKKAEVADLTAKKNKYKKHARAADTKLKEMKKKSESAGGGDGAANAGGSGAGGGGGGAGAEAEIEELRQAKARLEKKLKSMKQDYDELEKEVLALEEENQQLEEELGRKRAAK